MPAFDPGDSLGNRSRWQQVKYLVSIRSWCEAFSVATGIGVPKWF